jgi:hypothetical protein
MAPFWRLAAVLTAPHRRDRVVALLLIGYAAVWTLYGVLAKGSQDLHFDMGEAVAWSREVSLGTPKHPPLSAWVVKAWFTIFPLDDWAYYLLAIVVATSGLWIAWLVSARYLDGDKRVAGLALMTLVPFFNFQALKYNANSVLIPVWGLTTLWFLRSFETRSLGAAALAGVAGALSMYGKYWSVVLIAGLAIAALADPRRGAYFRSPAPWVTIAVGALALVPHVAWLVANDFSPFTYALTTHAVQSLWDILVGGAGFLAGTLGYMAVPAVLAFLMTRPDRAALADTLLPATPERHLAATTFWAPLLVAPVAALAARSEIVSLWAMPALTLMPVVLLSSPLVVVPRAALARLLAGVIALPAVAVLAAPGIAYVIHLNGLPNHAGHYRYLAEAIDRAWHQTTARPLGLVGSYTNILNGVIFYLRDRPSTYEVVGPWSTPWADEDRITHEGIALVCPVTEALCMNRIEALAASHQAALRTEVEISRRYFGVPDTPERYVIIIIPPRTLIG